MILLCLAIPPQPVEDDDASSFPSVRTHALLMAAAFATISPVAATSWRAYSVVVLPRPCVKVLHVLMMTMAMTLGWIGVASMHAFKDSAGAQHFTSLHSWAGLATLTLFTLTWCGIALPLAANPRGMLACSAPSKPPVSSGGKYLHTSLGVVAIGGGLLSVCTGILALPSLSGVTAPPLAANHLNVAGLLTCVVGAATSLIMRHCPMRYGEATREAAGGAVRGTATSPVELEVCVASTITASTTSTASAHAPPS